MKGLGIRKKVQPPRKESSEISAWNDQQIYSGATSTPTTNKRVNVKKPSKRNILRQSANLDKKSETLPKIMKVNHKNNSQEIHLEGFGGASKSGSAEDYVPGRYMTDKER